MMMNALKTSYKHTLKYTLVFAKIGAAFCCVSACAMGILYWKLSHGPVDITFAADKIKSAIVSSDHKTDLQFDAIVAEWPTFASPISIGLSGLKLVENGKPVMSIPQLGIRIAKAPLFFGWIKPEAIIAKDATLKLYRAKNGGVHLFLNNMKDAPASTEVSGKAVTGFKELGEALFQGGNLPDYHEIQPLSNMERFSIENAHLIIIDEETGKGWDIPQLNFELLRKPAEFTVSANYQDGDNQNAAFSFLLQKDRDNGTLHFSGDIERINASTLGRLFLPVQPTHGPQFIVKGKVEGYLDKDWNMTRLDSDVSSEQGDFNLDGLYETPLKFSKLAARISYDKISNKIILHDTHVDINNRTLEFSGEKLAGTDSSIFGLRVKIPEVTFDDIHSLWPQSLKDTQAADWLVKRLSKATIHNLDALIPIDLKNPDYVDPTQIDVAYDFENLTADYQAPLIPASEAKGSATLKGDVLSISIASGKLADMNIQKSKVEITHLTHPTTIGDVTIDANLSGNVSTILDYIGRDPISLGDKIGIDPAKVKGTTTLNAKVVFPALKDLPKEDVKVVVDAKMDNVLLPSITHGLDLTGGPYSVNVNAGTVVIAGKGALGGQPIDLTYTAYLDLATAPFVSSVKADVVANKNLRDKFGVHLDQFVEGDVPVKVSYQEEKNEDENISIEADITPSVIKFSPFKYKKPVGKSGKATCNVLIQKGVVKKVSDLNISIDKEGSATGNIFFGKVGKENDVKTGKFPNFTLAGANNFALDFTQIAPNVFDISIKGKQLDGRPFIGGGAKDDAKSGGTAVNTVVNVERIKTGSKPEQVLSAPTLSLKTNSDGDVTFLDLKGGFKDGTVSVSLSPDAKGRTKMSMSSNNAGGALRVLDIYDQMVGGTLDIKGQQIAGGGINDIVGRAQINNFTIVRAPFLAKLINLFSLSGLTELLQNKGIEFEKLKTEFQWKNSKSGRIISLQNGRTSGASIGLTFGGVMYQDKDTMDISGTFVPMSQINGFVNKIPLIGGLLTGGKGGGIIAATYAMTGKTEDPSVFVNPLSVLTPGFIRSFLFENKSTIFDDGGDVEDTKKPAKKGFNN